MQRVVMIGSRARGTPRPDSDLDLVVLVEPPAGSPSWGPAETVAERKRIQQQVPAPPVLADLWVRTTDQYAEARHVIGGVEILVDTEGLDLYSRPPERAPVVRRTPDQVRRELVSAWVDHALAALEGTVAIEANRAPVRPVQGQPKTAAKAARICVERATTALLVLHQIGAGKGGDLPPLIAQLSDPDRRRVADWFGIGQASESPSAEAHRVVHELLAMLSEARGMRPHLSACWVRYKQIAVR
ncbi:MAG TPA: nucleotidyltransferase domain-containing protein [Longimicrobiaceae bacterium]|nr:nucleotidyltransferase domain-containing protein [Longimicrobiaceae bacterium]